ncbi:MAG: M56 family metallopeptidase [Gemmatimonadota bacterium]|jgi:TonB family protein
MTPVLAWFTYSLVVGLLVGLSSWAAESALRAAGRPGRWAWAGGMAISALIPLGALVGEMEWARTVAVTPPMSVIPLVPLAVSAAPAASQWSVDRLLLAVWAVLAVVGLAQIVRLNRLVRRGHAAGSRRRVHGVDVVVTRRLGPAVWGIRRPKILLPEWTLSLDTRFRRLMLLHEGEHARAGDARVVLAALLLVALVPWNLALWWQLGQLRSAVELDCDERVLKRVRDPLNYGGLLLEVGRRRSGPVLGVALVERMPILERRLRRIIDAARRPPSMRKALWLGVPAAILLVTAVLTRDPMMAFDRDAAGSKTVVLEFGESPRFTPFTVAPELLNGDEVTRALEAGYPPLLRDAGIGGTAHVWLKLDAKGAVQQVQLNQSSGYPALDEAALKVAGVMRFSPASNRGTPVEVWVSVPVKFGASAAAALSVVARRVRESAERLSEPKIDVLTPPVPSEARQEVPNFPSFTPFTVAPRLRNGQVVAVALEKAYPPALRDEGIGGEVRVWFYIDEQGRVLRAQINRKSGYPALDEAALEVASMMEFTPALNRDKPARVWVSIPIKFNTR